MHLGYGGSRKEESMPAESATRSRWFKAVFAISVAIACFGWGVPRRQMPIDFHSALWLSIPVAAFWALVIAVSARQFGKSALWMLLGAPLALYWPIWLLLNGVPACYWHGNCV